MIWHNVEQNTDEWMQLRLGRVTASNFACFMANDGKAFGDPAKKYALQIALEIATGKKAEFSFSNEHMERGQEQEPIARMLYEQERFVDVTNGGFFDCGDYGDSPDGLVGEDGLIEIKSVIASTHYATMKRNSYDPAYKWQLVGHLDCSEREWVDFVSYCADFPESKSLLITRIYRGECTDELERLRARRTEFIALVQNTLNELKDATK